VAGAADVIVVELRRFFEPLSLALASPNEFAAFMRRFGFSVGGTDVGAAATQFGGMRTAINQFGDRCRSVIANDFDPTDVAAAAEAALPLFEALRTMPQTLSGLSPAGLSPQAFAQSLATFPEELFDALLTDYLVRYAPIVLHALALLGVIRSEKIPPSGDVRSRGLDYARPVYDWDRIRVLFDDPSDWAAQAYGWGVDFDSNTFILRLARIVEYIGGLVQIDDMSDALAELFMPHIVGSTTRPIIALAPIMRMDTFGDDGEIDVEASGEIGLAIFPVAGDTDATRRSDGGIAIGPYADGAVTQSVALSETATMTLTGSLGAVGGVVFGFRPSGAQVETGLDATAFAGAFGIDLAVTPSTGADAIVVLGSADGTRIAIDAFVAAIGGEISNDGFDFFAVHEAASEAIAHARTGGGPTLLEMKFTRYFGHFEGDQQTYRAGEVEHARAELDCLTRFAARVTETGELTQSDLDAADAEVAATIDRAVDEAKAAPLPTEADLLTDVYVRY
jgi:hypothetical protein